VNHLLYLLFLLCAVQTIKGQQPIGFLENNGEVSSAENNQRADDVLYKLTSTTTDVYITTRGLSYVFHKMHSDTASKKTHFEVERVDMNLVHATISKEQVTQMPIPLKTGIHQYFNSAHSTAPVITERIIIGDIYKNIDWVIYLRQDKNGNATLKHDFIFHRGADTRKLRIKYSANAAVQKDSTGKLEIKSKLGTIEEAAPVVYSERNRRHISVGVGVNGQYVSYFFRDAIASEKIILDPELYWGTFLTSPIRGIYYNDRVIGTNVETDSKANVYVLMNVTPGIGFPTKDPGNGAYYADLVSTSEGGIQIAKFSPEGILLWCTFFGKNLSGSVMEVDSQDNLYIAGNNQGPVPLKNGGGYFNSIYKQAFIAKFSNNGVLLWSSYIGNSDPNEYLGFRASDMVADRHGRIFITGLAPYYALPFKDAGNGAYFFNTPEADSPVFLMVFDESCKLLWSTQVGTGYGNAGVPKMCIDGNDNIFLVANPRYDTYPIVDGGGVSYNYGVNENAAITSFDAQWKMTWSTFLPGVPFGVGDVTADRDNNVFIVGSSARWGFPTTDPGGGAFIDNVTNPGLATAFIMKFSPVKKLVWATRFANNKQIYFEQAIADPTCDAIHIKGVMNDGYNGVPTINGGCSDGFYFSSPAASNGTGPIYLTFKSTGQQIYTSLTDFGYEYYNENSDFDVDPFGNRIYIYGCIRNFETMPSATKDPGNGAFFQPSRNNLAQATLLMKLKPSGVNASVSVSGSGCGCTKQVTVQPTCGQAPFTYQWSNGETGTTITNVCPGKYSVRVMDAACRDTLINFDVPPSAKDVVAFQVAIDTVSCNKSGSITVTSVSGGSAPYAYSLNGGIFQASNKFDNLPVGRYTITVRSNEGCEYFDSIFVDQFPVIEMIRKATTATHCDLHDGSVSIEDVKGGMGPFSSSLDGINYSSAIHFDQLAAGMHYLFVKDKNECIFKDSFMISTAPMMVDAILKVTDALCDERFGGVSVLSVTGGVGPFTYSVDKSAFTGTVLFSNLLPGEHSLTIKDAFGCVLNKKFSIRSSKSTPIRIVVPETNVCYGTQVTFETDLQGQPDGLHFNWNNGESAKFIRKTVTEGILVTLTVTNEDGCVSSDSVRMEVKRCDSSFEQCVVFPNAVTADGDGKNDAFGPAIMGCAIDQYELNIYNRYGELVFTTHDPYKKWDGYLGGKPSGNYTYVYHCVYTINGELFTKKGNFSIIR
jgi:gliding motility-associated-like protein